MVVLVTLTLLRLVGFVWCECALHCVCVCVCHVQSLVVDQLAAGEVDVHSVEPWDAGAVSGLARAHAVFCSTYLMPGGKAPSEEALQV